MRLYIQSDRCTHVDIENIAVAGGKGFGCYQLLLKLPGKFRLPGKDESIHLSQLMVRIHINNTLIGFGHMRDYPQIEWSHHAYERDLWFTVQLSPQQLSEIEKYRAHGDFKFDLWLSGVIEIYEIHSKQTQKDYVQDKVIIKQSGKSFTNQNQFTIPKQQWLEALDKMGFKQTLLFEMSFPSESLVGADVLKYLQKAQSHILDGHYGESVAECRKALESFEKQRKDKNLARKAVELYQKDREAMNLEQRFLFLRESLKNVKHPASHATEDSYTQKQAYSILGMTVALLASVEVSSV